MKRQTLLRALLIVACVGTAPAQADPCGGQSPFIDVPQNAGYCGDATWAKNANITTGCTATTFCPSSDVTRAQMVLFLRRMAVATFPTSRFTESFTLPPGDLDTTGVSSCTTPAIDLLATANLSFAHVHAVVSMRAGAGAADVQIRVGHSMDGGGFSSHALPQIVTVPAGQWGNGFVMAGFMPVFPGTSNEWRVELYRAPGSSTTGELSDLRCQLKVISLMAPVPPI
jgi:hypothetical protein